MSESSEKSRGATWEGGAGGVASDAAAVGGLRAAPAPVPAPGVSASKPKLVGYDWFRSLGSPKKIVAPMVDQSDLPYRELTRRYSADLVFTQMFNSSVFSKDHTYRFENFSTCPEDRPLIVQFAGNDPVTLLAAAKMVENCCDAVDINLGCPQGIAKRGHYGAFLMEELELLHTMVSTLANGLNIPVTCKTRVYEDYDRSLKLCETLVNAGASMLTIHGRTREAKGQYVKEADWETIRKLKLHFAGRIPIIANGGVETLGDLHRCLEFTKADGVMSSEAILENPALFAEPPCSTNSSNVNHHRQIVLAHEYLEECRQHSAALHYRTIRSHLQKMLFRYCTKHTELRDSINVAKFLPEFQAIVDSCKLIVSQSENCEFHYDDKNLTWYSRHRNPAHAHSGRVSNSASRLNTSRNGLIYTCGAEEEDISEIYTDDGIGLEAMFG